MKTNEGDDTGPAPSHSPEARPGWLDTLDPERVVEVDVREELRAGREPFTQIMTARAGIAPGGTLCLRAIFEPAPLYRVLGSQGFLHHAECLADDDWRVWFHLPGDPVPPEPRVLDVREMEPPDPLVHTLEAIEALPPGGTLVQINRRVPTFLLPHLEERGFEWEIEETEPDLVRVHIQRKTE
ncbi:MAG: DUF2249 domain-containing protein [Longimicrobiales bacterium]|nr:DUF2249 domain-containing protein [Longimicrobiales bacterium]